MKFQITFLLLISLTLISSCGEAQTENKEKTESVQSTTTEPIVLSPADFNAKMKTPNVQLIDVRTDAEVADGMIPNAIQMNVLDHENFVKSVAKLDKNKPVLVYCKSGRRSNKAAHYLTENGYQQVYDLDGGFMNWESSGFETQKQ